MTSAHCQYDSRSQPRTTVLFRTTLRLKIALRPSQRSNAVTYVTSGCQSFEILYQFKAFAERSSQESIAGNTVTKQSTRRQSQTVNKQELFYRYSTFIASLSSNGFIFDCLKQFLDFLVICRQQIWPYCARVLRLTAVELRPTTNAPNNLLRLVNYLVYKRSRESASVGTS